MTVLTCERSNLPQQDRLFLVTPFLTPNSLLITLFDRIEIWEQQSEGYIAVDFFFPESFLNTTIPSLISLNSQGTYLLRDQSQTIDLWDVATFDLIYATEAYTAQFFPNGDLVFIDRPSNLQGEPNHELSIYDIESNEEYLLLSEVDLRTYDYGVLEFFGIAGISADNNILLYNLGGGFAFI
jgi:hypothetical protein